MKKWDCLETRFLQNRHTDMLIVLYFICFTNVPTFTEILENFCI